MYITDATHFLDEKGAIGPQHGPGRKMADFLGTVIVAATLQAAGQKPPVCFKCAGSVKAHAAASGVIEWQCAGCGESGRITNWEGTLWDMTTTGGVYRAEH
jgi:hypothetical protein